MRRGLVCCGWMLLICLLISVMAGCTGETGTQSQTESIGGTASEHVSESASATETEHVTEEETEDPYDTAFCIFQDWSHEEVFEFYDSLENAIAAHPEGGEISLLRPLVMEEPMSFGPDEHYMIIFDCSTGVSTPNFSTGIVFDNINAGASNYIYFTSLEDLFSGKVRMDLHKGVFWNFYETENLPTGRYEIRNENAEDKNLDPEYTYYKTHDVEMFGVPYVATYDGYYYYELQPSLRHEVIGNSGNVNIVNNCFCTDEMEIALAGVQKPGYLVGYNWRVLLVKFPYGATYDDCMPPRGYCYYSSLERLCSVPNLGNTQMYIWSDREGFRPGQYAMELIVPDNRDIERLDEDGNLIEANLGMYHLTFTDEIWNFAPEWDDLWEQYPGWKAEYPEWVAEHPNANLGDR